MQLLDGDYNAIEGRIGAWIAGQADIVEAWRNGEDLYKRATAFVENIPESAVTKQGRSFGKVVELACQFGLGTDGFIRTCGNWGIECDEPKAHRAVHDYYRPTHPKVVNRWWFMDDCMRKAINSPGVTFGPLKVQTCAGMPYLLLRLPSGRSLAYPRPKITKRDPTREEEKAMAEGKSYPETRFLEITYWGQLLPSTQWGDVRIWGSVIFQNEVQAIAADIMAHGAMEAERQGMPPFALIHDQALALRDKGQSAEDFAAALGTLPAWAKGLPVKVEAKIAPFYSK